jgi:hypothetical protein
MAYYVAGAVVVSAVVGANSAKKAAKSQADAAREAAGLQAEATDQSLAQQQAMYDANVKRMSPYVEAGKGSLAALKSGMAPGGQFMKTFSGASFEQDPSYKWRLEQGQKALQASAAAKGRMMTGQGLTDISNYGQGAASQEYQAAYNRFNDQQSLLFNRLRGVAGDSQNAAAGLGTTGTQVASGMAQTGMAGAQQMGNYITGAGNAQAAGYIGAGNAFSSAVGTGLNAWQSNQYLNSLNKTPAAATAQPTAAGGTDYSLGSARFSGQGPS